MMAVLDVPHLPHYFYRKSNEVLWSTSDNMHGLSENTNPDWILKLKKKNAYFSKIKEKEICSSLVALW